MTSDNRNEQGFTLIELVLVITVLAILAVAVLPIFINVSTQAEQSTRDGVVGSVRMGIIHFRANDLATNGAPGNYPTTLDGVAAGTTAGPSNRFFVNVIQNGVADPSWSKDAGNALIYNFSDGTTTFVYTYVPATGAYTSPTAP